jgi:hypothetical protein
MTHPQEPTMTRTALSLSFSTQVAAFALSALTTLGVMAGIDTLAAVPAPAAAMAQAPAATAPAQALIVGKRASAHG